MKCSQCGRALDEQALELGACRYCGQAIISAGTINISPADATRGNNPPTGAAPFFDTAQSRYDWKDWPTGSVPAPGATHPTLPLVGGFPESAPVDGATSHNAPTLPNASSFASPAAPPPGTAPFGAGTPPAPGSPPFGASAPPRPAAPQSLRAAPASNVSTPPRQPPSAPARRSRVRLLALAGLLAIVLIVLITGGVLLAHSLNRPSAGASVTSVVATAPSTATPTARPTATAPAQPTATSLPAPTPTPTLPNVYNAPGLFTINYPNGWTYENSPPVTIAPGFSLTGVQFMNGTARFTVATGQEPGVAIPPDQVDTFLLGSLGILHTSTAQPTRIDGQNWTEKMGDNATGLRAVAASISINGHVYSILYRAPINDFRADAMQAFMPMIQSFQFSS